MTGTPLLNPGNGHDAVTSAPDPLQPALQMHQQGRLAEAAEAYDHILQREPNHVAALHLRGVVADQQGDAEKAIGLIRRSIELQNKDPEAHNNLGLALRAAMKFEEAEAAFMQALLLKPDYLEARFNLARTLMVFGKWAEGETLAREVLAKLPDLPDGHWLLANLLHLQGRFDEAQPYFKRYLAQKPDSYEGHYLLGTTLQRGGNWDEAEGAYRQALHYKSDYLDAMLQLGILAQGRGFVSEAVAKFKQILAIDPAHAAANHMLLLAMHYDSAYSAEELFRQAQEWGEKQPQTSSPPERNKNPDRKLKIGYVSGDLSDHPVGTFMEAVLASHARDRFEISCYMNGNEDELSEILKSYSDRWRNIANLTDDELTTAIKADGIDILVDLSGHVPRNRLLTFARKPAPVQATWLGYFDTTGLKAMDYILCDRYVVPEKEERFYVEKPERLPDSYLCFTLPGFELAPGGLPMEKNGFVTFGSFNYLTKTTPQVVDIWSRILKSVPNSKLFLKNQSLANAAVRAHYTDLFAKSGIGTERLRLEGPAQRQQLMGGYREVDIALDPFPYNGGTTTVEALWMGVPVIALSGDRFVTHVSESILATAGVPELVQRSLLDYVNAAGKLANDLERLKRYRSELRDKLIASPVCQAKPFTQNLEAAYRGMWQRYCEAA